MSRTHPLSSRTNVLIVLATFALHSPVPAQEPTPKLHADLGRVLAEAPPGELVPITIVMEEQVPREELRQVASAPSKADRRAYVTIRLKDVARSSQADLLAYLEAKVASGEASRLRPLWIHNVLAVQVVPAVALEIADRQDVAYLHHDPPRGSEVLVSAPAPAPAPPAAPAGGSPTCGLNLIGAPQVWSQLGVTGKGVVVGMIDTGLCKTHSDITGQVWNNPCEIANNGIDDDQNGYVDDIRGWNFRNDNKNTNDDSGHGSHTSGTVAGDGTAGIQSGVAPDARIMVLKFWNDFAGEQSVWEAMQYGVDNGADILSASLGWPHSFSPDRATWRAVCENSIAAGVVVVYAAGNEGCGGPPDDVRTPGDVPDVICVGAVDCSDVLASFSSCGPVTWQNVPPYNDHPYPPGLTKPNVSGPGVDTDSHDLCAGYFPASGTSMATPHVAGTAALLLQADPTLDHFGVRAILELTAVDLGVPGLDNQFGSGRIDALAAVTSAVTNGNYCQAKMNSCGALPEISAKGYPSATETSGFRVKATNMAARQVALLVYTDQGIANTPFFGGHLCLASISRSVPVMDTTGTPGLCDGTVRIDMNAFRSGALGGFPEGFLSVPGTTVHCQFWGRDPANSFGILLTAGLKYTVCP